MNAVSFLNKLLTYLNQTNNFKKKQGSPHKKHILKMFSAHFSSQYNFFDFYTFSYSLVSFLHVNRN